MTIPPAAHVTLRRRPELFESKGETAVLRANANHSVPWERSVLPPVTEKESALQALEGSWVNADHPSERYVVTGASVTRSCLASPPRQFALQWDPYRGEVQWGYSGRLHLVWLSDSVVSWVQQGQPASWGWRWRRAVPQPAVLREAAAVRAAAAPGDHRAATLRPPVYLQPRLPEQPPTWAQRQRSQSCGPPSRVLPSSWQQDRRGAAPPQQQQHQQRGSFVEPRASPSGYGAARSGYTSARAQPYHYRQAYSCSGYSPVPPRRHYGYYPRQSWGHPDHVLACGWTASEASDLLFRELTPEDYEMLCRLDERVEKKPNDSNASLEKLVEVSGDELIGEQCTVCLTDFEAGDEAAQLPCGHIFHRACIKKWLSECRTACPLCGVDVNGATATTTCASSSSSSSSSSA